MRNNRCLRPVRVFVSDASGEGEKNVLAALTADRIMCSFISAYDHCNSCVCGVRAFTVFCPLAVTSLTRL